MSSQTTPEKQHGARPVLEVPKQRRFGSIGDSVKKTMERFLAFALLSSLAFLGSSCGDSSGNFDNFSASGGNSQVVADSLDSTSQYDGQVILNDGLALTSSFVIDEVGNLVGSFTVDPSGAGLAKPTLVNGIGSQPANGGPHVLEGTYDLEGLVEDNNLSASGKIFRQGLEVGLFFVDLTSGLASFRFVGGSEPETGLYPYPTKQDIQYFLEHIRLGSHRHPGWQRN